MERIEAWTFLLVFNQGKEVENPRDRPQWRKFKGKSFMRKTKLPDLLEHFSLNSLTWPKWSNRWRTHISQINLCFCLCCVVLRTISVSEIQTTYWNLITELPINNWSYKSNKYHFESPGYHYWKSALIAANSQTTSISFNSSTQSLLLKWRTVLPHKLLTYTGAQNWASIVTECYYVLT